MNKYEYNASKASHNYKLSTHPFSDSGTSTQAGISSTVYNAHMYKKINIDIRGQLVIERTF